MAKIPYYVKSSKDILIDELRAQNQQLKNQISKHEKTELDLFVLMVQENIPEYKTGDGPPFGTPLSIVERVKLLVEKVKKIVDSSKK